MIEQAASDKVLFLNESNQSIRHVDLRFPEYVSSRLRVCIQRPASTASVEERYSRLRGPVHPLITFIYRQFNNGAPWNVPAGQGHANIDELIAKYHKENQAAQEKRLQQLRDNDVPRERPVEHLTKGSPGAGGG